MPPWVVQLDMGDTYTVAISPYENPFLPRYRAIIMSQILGDNGTTVHPLVAYGNTAGIAPIASTSASICYRLFTIVTITRPELTAI